jgi:hypothetical protein
LSQKWGQVQTKPKVDVVECTGGLVRNVTVACTVGLSHFDLHSPTTGHKIRQEFFWMMKEGPLSPRVPGILGQVVEERVISGHAILRGEAIWKSGTLLDNGDFMALYATLPVYYPEEMWVFHDDNMGDIVLCSLLAIKEQEWCYLEQHGWRKFEELLDQAPFDLFDLSRPSLV